MSLKKADWTAVLNQPKNAGLKTGGGTGVGKALEAVDAAETKFQANHTVANGTALDTALKALKTTCEATINKHQKVYTTACAHLQKVVTSATNRMKALTGEMNVIRQEEQEAQRKTAMRHAIDTVCDHALAAVRGAKDMNELNTLWTKFGNDLGQAAHGSAKYAATVNKVKQFNKKPDASGILSVRKEYVQIVQEAKGQSHNV